MKLPFKMTIPTALYLKGKFRINGKTFTFEGMTLLTDRHGLMVLDDNGNPIEAVKYSEQMGTDGENKWYQKSKDEFFNKIHPDSIEVNWKYLNN